MSTRGLTNWALVSLLGLLAGCSSDTTLFITIDTDLRVPEELNGVRIRITTDVKTLLDRTWSIPTQDDMPATLTVINETEKEVWVTVYVTGIKDVAAVAEGSARALFIRGETVDVDVYLKRLGPDDLDGGTDAGRDGGIPHDAAQDSGNDAGADAEGDGTVTDGGASVGTEAPEDGGGDGAEDTGVADAGPVDAPDAGDPFDVSDGSGLSDGFAEDAGSDDTPDDTSISDGGQQDAGCAPDCGGRCGGPDGCNGTCPDNCVAPDTCSGGGTQYVCGCTKTPQPTACKSKCGEVDDGCGGKYNCGDCSDGYACVGNACACASNKLCLGICCPSATDACHNDLCCAPKCTRKCGGAPDECGGQCTECGVSELCEGTACVHCGDRDENCCAGGACNGTGFCKNGLCVPTDCTGLPDFMLCNTATDPDRTYDICVNGVCVSPGCGDVSCNPPGPHFPIPDTGQRKCYDAAAETTCPAGSGAPCNVDGSPQYCGQDAQYGWDATHQQNERYAAAEPVAGERIVKDNVTGLEWQGCAAGLKGSDCATGTLEPRNWEDSLGYCDALNWGGVTGWRLPDAYEIQTTADFGATNPSIDVSVFPQTPNGRFWTSTVFELDANYPWVLSLGVGNTQGDEKPAMNNVRCVRGTPASRAQRFLRSETTPEQPIVQDCATGLIWQGCVAGLRGGECDVGLDDTMDWLDALTYCESLEWSGESGWRLPNVVELVSIVDYRRSKPAFDPQMFPSTPGASGLWFWTATHSSAGNVGAWSINSAFGMSIAYAKTTKLNLRCVRTGP
ncbi:MAG: DUF1566 domain-containing protein [Deltaproteobacteria bacterium]|nr:DUF1566 domain-containing protein [Deltaproteobacteria bacterium]